MVKSRGLRQSIGRAVIAVILSACGDSGTAPPPPVPPPPPPPPPGVGAAGGTVTGPAGAQVVVPAGALATNTAIAIAQSGSGAPILPTGMTTFGQMFAFTPHGTTFAVPVTVTVPFDPAAVPSGRTPVLYKTNSTQTVWERVAPATVTGNVITAAVTGFSFLVVGNVPPSITEQPANAIVTEPEAATFTVTALGSPPFTYQWERSDDGGQTWVAATGASATSREHTTDATSVGDDDGDRYRVVVASLEGSATSSAALLTVVGAVIAPAITAQPQNQTVSAGADATFTVTASGTNLNYQWRRSSGGAFADIPGATAAAYTVVNAQAGDDGAGFQVVVSNSAGSVTSAVATLTVGATQPLPVGPRIGAGQNFSVMRFPNGAPRSWGSDEVGQLGAGPGDDSRGVPGAVATGDVVAIVAGQLHALAVRANGEVVGWGYDMFGQLGDGGGESRSTPVTARQDGGAPITQAIGGCGGTLHSLVLRSTNPTVMAMGHNQHGQLGDGTQNDRLRAVPILSGPVAAVACGDHFSLALTGGQVRSWGANESGQLGIGSTLPSAVPVPVTGLPATATAIAAGSAHALALLDNGQVWGWGSASAAKLGAEAGGVDRLTPIQITGFPAGLVPEAIAAGGGTSAAILSDGKVYLWGSNETGQLGRGAMVPAVDPIPQAANLPASCRAVEVAISRALLGHVLVRCSNHAIYSWGFNDKGQLGIGGGGTTATPTLVVPGI